MKGMPAPASRNFLLLLFLLLFMLLNCMEREELLLRKESRKKKKKSPFWISPPLHQWSQFLLCSSNNNTFVGLCVTSHDSIKKRWINNETNGRRLVALHGSASSPLHRKAPHSLGQMHNSCVVGMHVWTGNAHWWWGVVHTSESQWEIFFLSFFFIVIVVRIESFNQLAAVKSLGCYMLCDWIWNQNSWHETQVFSSYLKTWNTVWWRPNNVQHPVWFRNDDLETRFRFEELYFSCEGRSCDFTAHPSILSGCLTLRLKWLEPRIFDLKESCIRLLTKDLDLEWRHFHS